MNEPWKEWHYGVNAPVYSCALIFNCKVKIPFTDCISPHVGFQEIENLW